MAPPLTRGRGRLVALGPWQHPCLSHLLMALMVLELQPANISCTILRIQNIEIIRLIHCQQRIHVIALIIPQQRSSFRRRRESLSKRVGRLIREDDRIRLEQLLLVLALSIGIARTWEHTPRRGCKSIFFLTFGGACITISVPSILPCRTLS